MKGMDLSNPISRRNLLKAGLLSLAGSSGSLNAVEAEGFVDAHVHLWSPDLTRYPLAAGFSAGRDMKPPSFTPAEFFVHSRPCGVARTVLIQMSFYATDNRYMLEVMKMHPGIFGGVAIVDENSPDLVRAMKELKREGVRGFRIYTSREKAERWRDSAGMCKMWAVGGDEGLAMCLLLANPDSLPAVRRMCEEYRTTRVVIDHFARIGKQGEISHSDVDALCRLSEFPNVYVKLSAFYALGSKKPPYGDMVPMIRALCESFGPSRLMWASDCPYQVQPGHTYAESINLIRNGLDFLTEDDRRWILRKTAEGVFFSGV